jgi:hypothetical protein
MAWADLHPACADDYASTVRYHLNLGLEPPSSNHHSDSLADEFAEVDSELRRLKVRRDELRQEILARGRDEIAGHRFSVIIEEKTARRLDHAKLEEKFGRVALDERRVVRTGQYLRVERLY